MGPLRGGVLRQKYTSATSNIIFVGNSLGNGLGGSITPAAAMAPLPPLNGGGNVWNLSHGGFNITQLRGLGASEPDSYWGGTAKNNVLFFWEGTNTICNGDANAGKTGLAAAADAVLWCQERIAAHPDVKIIVMTTLPRYDNQVGRGIAANNAELDAYNNYLKANYRSMGAKAVLDVRASGVFAYTGTSPSDQMAPLMSDNVHLNTAGYQLIGQLCADALKRLPAR